MLRSLQSWASLISFIVSYKAWKERKPLYDRTFDRIEPVTYRSGWQSSSDLRH
jgi:hypothetical protein